jgi:hypothetical protein
MTQRWCGTHHGYVPDHEAQIVGATETGSGPGAPAYACHKCVRDHGLVPPAFIGRQHAAPIPPAGRAS